MAQRPKKRRNAHGSKPGSRLAAVAMRFLLFMGSYSMHFKLSTSDQSLNARNYLECLSTANLTKNMERMAERNPKAEYQSLQQFITDSPWAHREVMDHVATDANTLIGDPQGTALVIDESGYPKKGKNSVGVARQWLGCIGKVDNGQVAVYGALVNGTNYCLVDSRLYLPEEWTSDKKRLDKARVPKEERTFKTKETIALEIVAHSRQLGLQYGWVVADAGYGKGLAFPLALEEMGEKFICDFHKDQSVYLEKPQLEVPAYSGRGRIPKNPQPKPESIRVDKFIAGQPETAWQEISVREGAKGHIKYEYLFSRIWVYSEEYGAIREWYLIARRDIESKSDYKYSLSNAPADTPKSTLTYMQAQRYWVERSFEEGKQNCGMKDYQHRKWQSWHHHTALVMMLLLFLMMEKIENRNDTPLLTGRDITDLLTFYLQEPLTEEQVLAQIEARQARRLRDIRNTRRRKRRAHG